MQTYPLKIVGAAGPVVMVDGNLFVYESATATPPTGDTRIRVKPESGEEIVLRPGQRFRIPDKRASRWNVSSYDGTTTIDGMLIIGAGEFDDANTLNKVTLDATFANQVTVTSMPAVTIAGGELEVKNDAGNPLSVTLSGVGQVQENLIAYTGSHSVDSSVTGGSPIQIVSAAANVNGVIINKIMARNSSAAVFSIIAKATAPANNWDGDVLAYFDNTAPFVFTSDSQKIKVPAGRGIWLFGNTTANFARSIVYTILPP